MSDGLTPYSVIMIRLVVQPKFYEVHHTGRSKSVLAEEVVKFLLKEIETAPSYNEPSSLQKYFSFKHLLNEVHQGLPSLGGEAVALLQSEMEGIKDLHSMHGLLIESFNGINERMRDQLHNRNNILDLYLRRASLEFKKMEFHHLSQLFDILQIFLHNSLGDAAELQASDFVPRYIRDKMAESVKSKVDEIQIGLDPFSGDIPSVEYDDIANIKSSRFGPYIRAVEHFASGRHEAGMKSLHDFFDNNIFMYFDQDTASKSSLADQKKDEYKMAVEHSSLQQVSISMKNFLFEASSKLLEETLRWAQLNHHETQVQYSLLQKGQIMHKLGDSKMHFTFVEDALVKALAFNNYSLQIQACMQLIATDAMYDLNALRKETGQYKNLNSSLIINNAFVKLLIDTAVRPVGPSLKDLALLRTAMLNQRKDYLCGLGYRKRNLLLRKPKQSPLAILDKDTPAAQPAPGKVTLAEYLHLENLLDESCELFYRAWELIIPRTQVGGCLSANTEGSFNQTCDYEATFFQSYFQAKLLLRRRDLDSIHTYLYLMESVTKKFPEPLLVFKLWAFRNDLMIERGSHEEAFTSSQFLLKNLEGSGYKKDLFLLEKCKVALVLFRTGKHLRAFEELNTAVLSAKEHSLNDVYVRCKLLEIEMNHSLGFYSKCVLSLQKLGSAVMMSSNLNKVRFRELEIRCCLSLAKERDQSDAKILLERVNSHAHEAIPLAANLDLLQTLKQLFFVTANVNNILNNTDKRSEASSKVMRVVSAEKFFKQQGCSMLNLDDIELNWAANRQLSEMVVQLVSCE